MSEWLKWDMGTKDAILIGELNCPYCKKNTNVFINGKESGDGRNKLLSLYVCPRCGNSEDTHWVNKLRPWDSRGCLFVVDDEAE